MRQAEFDDFVAVLNATAELYNRTLSSFAIGLYWSALRDYDLAAVKQALGMHIRNPDTGQFMPKPADVVRMIGGTTQDAALQAWAKVDKAIRRVGTYASVVFDDSIIHLVINDIGGWIALGQKTEDEWPFVAKEFENRYRGYRLREPTEYSPILIGITEAANTQRNLISPPPVLIGNQALAKAVLDGGVNKPLLEFSQIKLVTA